MAKRDPRRGQRGLAVPLWVMLLLVIALIALLVWVLR